MSEHAELHSKLLSFLMSEWARKDNRQLVAVELMYSPGQGYKDENIRKWVRQDEAELFAEFGNLEKLVQIILEITEGEADAKPPGKHRFFVRTHQFAGERATHSFSMSPSFKGASDDLAMAPSGGGGGGGGSGGGGGRADQNVIANHAGQLMRINAQMFEGTIRVLGQQNMSLHEQVATLTAENATLRHELEDARSNKMDREFQIAMAAEKNARTNAGFQKVLQIGSVIAAKIGSAGAMGGSESPIALLIQEFYKSLEQPQIMQLMQMLNMQQKIMFMEIVNMVKPKEPQPPPQGSQSPGTPSSAPGP